MKQLLMTLAKAGIGALVGAALGMVLGEDIQVMCILSAGIAFGWKFASGVVGSIISTNFAASMMLLAVKGCIAFLVGWVVMFIEIIKGIICAVMEFRGAAAAK